MDLVRFGRGNTYYVDADGGLTFRMSMEPTVFTGNPSWILANYKTKPRLEHEIYALDRFERNGLRLPKPQPGAHFVLQARCPSDNDNSPRDGYCRESVARNYDPDVCPANYVQVAYDKCCQKASKVVVFSQMDQETFKYIGFFDICIRGSKYKYYCKHIYT